jgi:hypothetical protein
MDTTKVDSVQNRPQPRSVQGLRGFLGLAGYYRRFIKDFGAIAAPLTQSLKRKEKCISVDWRDQLSIRVSETGTYCSPSAPLAGFWTVLSSWMWCIRIRVRSYTSSRQGTNSFLQQAICTTTPESSCIWQRAHWSCSGSQTLSHPFSKTNQVLPICMPGSSSIHIVTKLVNGRNNIT